MISGVASSGKSSVIRELGVLMEETNCSFEIVPEEETIRPILADDIDVARNVAYLANLLAKTFSHGRDIVVFERLLFTYAWMNGCRLAEFSRAIGTLRVHASAIAFLTVDEWEMSARIRRTAEVRGREWAAYIARKGEPKEIVAYYRRQQQDLLNMLAEISLPFRLYRTTGRDFAGIAREIYRNQLAKDQAPA